MEVVMFHPRRVVVVLACMVFIFQPVFAGTGEKITFGFLPYFSATKLIQLHTPPLSGTLKRPPVWDSPW